MAAPIGNKNSRKENRLVRDTLRKVALQNPHKLRAACEKLLDKAVEGDVTAFSQFRDTLDGKPMQTTDMTVTHLNSAERLSDDELANIATGSGTGTPEQEEGEASLH